MPARTHFGEYAVPTNPCTYLQKVWPRFFVRNAGFREHVRCGQQRDVATNQSLSERRVNPSASIRIL
jgi:hypothetical protein